MNRWLRFCQPIGCALITLALLETACNFFWLLLQYTTLTNYLNNYGIDFFKSLAWNFLIALRFLLTFSLWIGVIFKGKNVMLILWVVLSFLNDAAILSFVITETCNKALSPSGGQSTINVWRLTTLINPWPIFISLSIFILFRLYLLLVGIQGVLSLNKKYQHNARSMEENIRDNNTDDDFCLEPIGDGFCDFLSFLKDYPAMAAIILLTSEVIWNMEQLGFRELFVFMLNGRGRALLELELDDTMIDYVFLEDNMLRSFRIILAFAGLMFFYKERLNFVRLWILIYLISFICSNVIYALSVAIKDLNWIVFHAICHTFDNVFRLFVLFISFKYALVYKRTFM